MAICKYQCFCIGIFYK